MNKTFWYSLIGMVVVVFGIAFIIQNKRTNDANKTKEVSQAMNSNGMMDSNDEITKMQNEKMEPPMGMEDKNNTMSMASSTSDESMMTKKGAYKDYSLATVDQEQKAGQKVVLFFHASWCPYCKAADAAFKANSEKIPTGVTVLKTDYDSQVELKKKYGVATQHTFVQIDAQGNSTTKWVSGDIELLAKNIK